MAAMIKKTVCGLCGRRVSFATWWHNWRRGGTTYPQRLINGTRQERSFPCLCERCEARAAAYRTFSAPADRS